MVCRWKGRLHLFAVIMPHELQPSTLAAKAAASGG
jgi:hypothetical protein